MVADRVFRGDCATREVYDEGTKDIALSVVGGINCKHCVYWIVESLFIKSGLSPDISFSSCAFHR